MIASIVLTTHEVSLMISSVLKPESHQRPDLYFHKSPVLALRYLLEEVFRSRAFWLCSRQPACTLYKRTTARCSTVVIHGDWPPLPCRMHTGLRLCFPLPTRCQTSIILSSSCLEHFLNLRTTSVNLKHSSLCV